MTQQKISLRFIVLIGLVIIAAMTRLLPHPPNFAPMGAIVLFGAAYFRKPILGLVIALLAIWFTDLILNNTIYAANYDGFQWFSTFWVYLGFIAIFALGLLALKKISLRNLVLTSISGSLLFFLITNFGAWKMSMGFYPDNFAGLMACYTAGIPFFWNSLLGDLFYVAVLFGSFELIKQRYPQLALSR